MKLYYKPGACSLASHIILQEIGHDFEIESVDTDNQITESGDNFSKINPKGYVPALRLDDGEIVTEGTAVLQYLADQNPEAGLAPKPGTLERTRLQEHLNYTSSELHKAFGPFFSSSASDEEKQSAKENVGRKMDHFESVFDDGRSYLLGDKFSVADAYFFVVSSWAIPTGIGLDKWPRIAAFSTRVAGRETVQNAMRAEGLLN
jgi:glutathione S-transferase